MTPLASPRHDPLGWPRGLALVLGLILCAVAVLRPAAADPALQKLTIVTAGGARAFEVEVMATEEERAKGLMFRRYLPADRGMLFDFKETAPVAMWMKNTFIPLDMVFIRPDGTIARIAEDTEPHSTRAIPSGEPVLAVLEINAGTAQKLGIKPGDRVQHSLFGSAK